MRAPAADQHRRQQRVQDHRQHLHHHGRPHDARATQRRAHRHERELQRQPRGVPVEIGGAGRDHVRVGRDRAHVGAARHEARDQREHTADRRQQHRLVEHQVRFRLVLATDRVRDQRHRADAEHLRQREDHEARGSRAADARDRCIPEPRHEVQVHQQVQGLEQHADRDRQRHRHQRARHGALRQIFHRVPPNHPHRSRLSDSPRRCRCRFPRCMLACLPPLSHCS